MTFVDANVPMYVVGEPHPNKPLAIRALERLLVDGEPLVTDAEVLQEILHRYRAIRRDEAIDDCLQALLGLVGRVLPVEEGNVLRARALMRELPLGARDALHVAIMKQHGIERVLSFDTAFDAVPGIERIAA